MPLEPTDERHLNAAMGYCGLGMFLDAAAELEGISPEVRHLPEVLAVKVEIYRGLENWGLMHEVAKRLAEHAPADPQWPISWVFATRRAQSLEAAKLILLEAMQKHPREPLIRFNLACYECQLGDLESAKQYLKEAIKMRPGLRAAALDDPDLQALWDSLATEMDPKSP